MKDFFTRYANRIEYGAPSGCWLWAGAWNGGKFKHGMLTHRQRTLYAHRCAYAAAHGPIPPGMVVRHTCDTPPCVNPAHLLLGTQRDNIHDAVQRGRLATGVRNGHAKLCENDVREIRVLLASGRRQSDIARAFGVNFVTIYDIRLGRSWRSVA